jgi:hypothetical protein
VTDARPVGGPRTVYGNYLRAYSLRQADRRREMLAELDRKGWDDSIPVLETAFDLAVNRLFRPDSDLAEITAFVAGVRDAFGAKNVPALEAEAIIRESLGEDTQTDDIDGDVYFTIKVLVICGVVDVLKYTESQIDELLVEAERQVAAEGYRPATL